MKQVVRIGTFETNSSSTHSLIICSEEEYSKLQTEELLIDIEEDELVTEDDAIERIKKRYNEYFCEELTCDDRYDVLDSGERVGVYPLRYADKEKVCEDSAGETFYAISATFKSD